MYKPEFPGRGAMGGAGLKAGCASPVLEVREEPVLWGLREIMSTGISVYVRPEGTLFFLSFSFFFSGWGVVHVLVRIW